ncbi:MAG: nitroreductase family protein [Salinivirgaceae bacterium]|nr:nitroreductase family protein [Salinivirgaceae bacterium]
MNKLIEKRYSPRAFADKNVDKNSLELLFKAASYAPSARNEQPWQFFYATKENKEHYQNMFEILNDWNQQWAQSAPVLISLGIIPRGLPRK